MDFCFARDCVIYESTHHIYYPGVRMRQICSIIAVFHMRARIIPLLSGSVYETRVIESYWCVSTVNGYDPCELPSIRIPYNLAHFIISIGTPCVHGV